MVETLIVAPENVAGHVEAIRGERRRELGAVVISVHEGGTSHFEHALLCVGVAGRDQAQLDLRMRVPD
jgi:hypothetical protein